jgi:DNA-binding transcriptional MerR regulator
MAESLTIGQAAATTGVSAKTIRYYEQVGVVPAPGRTPAGYRQYTRHGVQRLLFVRRARALGLSLQTIKALTATLDGPGRPVRPRLRRLVQAQLLAVQQRMAELEALTRELQDVLRRLRARPERASGDRCRCLDAGRSP